MAGAYNVLPGPMVNFIGQSCCTLAPPVAGDTYVGLAVRSGPLPLPMIPGLGGLVLSSQCIVFCPIVPGFSTSLSNCLSWQIQSN